MIALQSTYLGPQFQAQQYSELEVEFTAVPRTLYQGILEVCIDQFKGNKTSTEGTISKRLTMTKSVTMMSATTMLATTMSAHSYVPSF